MVRWPEKRGRFRKKGKAEKKEHGSRQGHGEDRDIIHPPKARPLRTSPSRA